MTYLLYAALALVLLLPTVALFFCGWLAVRTGEHMKIASMYLRSTAVFFASVPMFVAGWFVVAIALPFRVTSPDTKPFTQYPGEWQLVSLPQWALWWDNPCDGALGDWRGWWDNYCRETYGRTCRDFFSMWNWMAIRNSSDYWSRVVVGVDASMTNVVRADGGTLWQFLVGTRCDGKQFCLFEGFIPYSNGTHGMEWRIGWKVALDDNPDASDPLADRMRGSVYRIRPWLAI